MTDIKAIIMAGGSGSRLWPLSRALHPKQFLTLNGEYTMLQATVKRLSGLNIRSSITLCNEEHRFIVAHQMKEIDVKSFNEGLFILHLDFDKGNAKVKFLKE